MQQRTIIPAGADIVDIIFEHGSDILASPGMQLSDTFMQHGTTSVLVHSLRVTSLALALARNFAIAVNVRALTRGALLHDYFLYDWHKPHRDNVLHGFTHPFTACRNAVRDHAIGKLEQHMIKTHMFPLVPLVPTGREAALLCLADKIIATRETAEGKRGHLG
ncbi:MAG: phosphohydrolase [Atopobiaceae bacterium]|nr:phosphohydrolase [Atopobiaceae bacterium]